MELRWHAFKEANGVMEGRINKSMLTGNLAVGIDVLCETGNSNIVVSSIIIISVRQDNCAVALYY